MQNILIQDVFECFIKDEAVGGKSYFLGLTTKTDVTQTVKQESIRGII
jgi:hypothetical protein